MNADIGVKRDHPIWRLYMHFGVKKVLFLQFYINFTHLYGWFLKSTGQNTLVTKLKQVSSPIVSQVFELLIFSYL